MGNRLQREVDENTELQQFHDEKRNRELAAFEKAKEALEKLFQVEMDRMGEEFAHSLKDIQDAVEREKQDLMARYEELQQTVDDRYNKSIETLQEDGPAQFE